MTTTSDTASGLREELGQDTAHLRETLTGRARQEAEAGKSKALGLAQPASEALGAAASALRDNPEAPDWMASGLQSLARQIERFAGDLEGRSLDDLGRDASRFASENPGTFLAASAAAGFAAARLLRAGADKKRHAQDGRAQGGIESRSYADEAAPVWPADENAMPSGAGGSDFGPAYGAEGGTIR